MNIPILRVAVPSFLAGAALIVSTSTIQAALVSVNSRGALVATDSVKWGGLGSPFDTVSNPFNTTTANGVGVKVSMPGTDDFTRFDEGTLLGTGWKGNFAKGDKLLSTSFDGGSILLDFASPVSGGGVQIQSDVYGAFTARIQAFDAGGSSLGFFDFRGNSTDAQDNSAVFIGLASDSANIDKLAFNIINYPDPDFTVFAINQVDVITDGKVPVVPEVTTWAPLLAVGLMGFEALRRRRSPCAA